jgi:hypothetical protein
VIYEDYRDIPKTVKDCSDICDTVETVESETISTSISSTSVKTYKRGGIKCLSFAGKTTSEISQESTVMLCTLDSDYYPAFAVEKIIMLVSGERIKLNISTSGVVTIMPYSSAIASGHWITIYEMFI